MADLIVEEFGKFGVNVDKSPFDVGDNELLRGANAMSDISSGKSALRKRPGLLAFNTTDTVGVVLGGISLPLIDLSNSGLHVAIYIGRGPVV